MEAPAGEAALQAALEAALKQRDTLKSELQTAKSRVRHLANATTTDRPLTACAASTTACRLT
jgi:hypothetical protein